MNGVGEQEEHVQLGRYVAEIEERLGKLNILVRERGLFSRI